MTDNTLSFSDEELEQSRQAQIFIKNMIETAREIVNNPDSCTKEEIVTSYAAFVELFAMMNDAGQQLIEGSAEISKLTDPQI